MIRIFAFLDKCAILIRFEDRSDAANVEMKHPIQNMQAAKKHM